MRKELFRFGPARASVRGKLSSDGERVVVLWTDTSSPRQRSWPNTPAGRAEARAWAKGFAEARDVRQSASPVRPSMRALWTAYAEAEFPSLRPRSRVLYGDDWRKVEQFFGAATLAEDVSAEMVGGFRKSLDRLGLAHRTVGQVLKTMKLVYAWGERTETIARNRVRLYRYKVPKEARGAGPGEYRADEFQKILATLDPTKASQWRAYVALALCGYQGARSGAVLRLQWADVQGDTFVWPAGTDKTGKEWQQPIRPGSRRALMLANEWRQRMGYAGPYVLPAASTKNRGAHYTAQSLWAALRAAETRSGVTRQQGRAAHGFRRMLFGDVAEATGDPMLALYAIGDSDARMIQHYGKRREDRIGEAFAKLDAEARPKLLGPTGTEPERDEATPEGMASYASESDSN
jgi:integrase